MKWRNMVRTEPGVVIHVYVHAPDNYTATEMFRSMYGREKLVCDYAIPCHD